MVAVAGKHGYVYGLSRDLREVFFQTPVMRIENVDAPLTPEGTRFLPGTQGGTNWYGPSYSPPLNMLFVPSIDRATAIKLDGGSCPSSLRVNTRGLPGDHHKGTKAYTRGPSGPLSGPRTPGDVLDASHADARRRSGPLPLLLPTTPLDSHPHRLRPRWHTKQQHVAQRPDMVGQPCRHGRCTGPPLPG